MKRLYALLATTALLLSGCANIILTEKNVSLITASEVVKGSPPKGISSTFPLDSRIYAYASITWDDLNSAAGSKRLESKWYKGDKLISNRSMSIYLNSTPFYAWDSLNAVAFGPGDCRVDMYIDGLFVASKRFTVVDKQ